MISSDILYGRMLRSLFVAFILLVSTVAGAQEIKEQELGNTPGLELQHGVVYKVMNNVTITSKMVGQAALTVTKGSTVTIYIHSGASLTVKGHDGDKRSPATPGIYVPLGSTLIITGQGYLSATGGNAGRGSDGERGGAGWIDIQQNCGAGGIGGTGGAGGGGAAPGIGGTGGVGASQLIGPKGNTLLCEGSSFDGSGNKGYPSNQGADGMDAGNVYLLGTVAVHSNPGKATGEKANPGNDYGPMAIDAGSGWSRNYTSGGGGPGGGGGSGYSALYGIGGGAPGGQSGTTGGSGGTFETGGWSKRRALHGAGGRGGVGEISGLPSPKRAEEYDKKKGGEGGDNIGKTAKHGGNGRLCIANGARYLTNDRESEKTWSMPGIISVKCYIDANGGIIKKGKASQSKDTTNMYYGTRPDQVIIPTNGKKSFDGYYTSDGVQVFDASGKCTGLNTRTKSFTVYARWYDGYADFGKTPLKTGYIATAKTTVILLRKDKYETVIPKAGSEVTFSGELRSVGIFEDGNLVRHYVLAHKDNTVCFFEELRTRSYLLSENNPQDYTDGKCNHALMGGRSAFHTISSGTKEDGSSYDLKKCYLCELPKQVPTDNDYIGLTGNNYINTEYAMKPNTSIFTRMQYKQCKIEYEEQRECFFGGINYARTSTVPLIPYYKYGAAQMLYLQKFVGGPGNIEQLTFITHNARETSFIENKHKVYMKMTTEDKLTSGPININEFTLVYDGEIMEEGPDNTTIKLQTPFQYDGKQNLIIAIFKYDGGLRSSIIEYAATRVISGLSLFSCSNSNPDCGKPATADFSYDARSLPYIIFTFKLKTGDDTCPFGIKDESNQYAMDMKYSNSEGYFNTYMNVDTKQYGEEGETILFPEIDYDILAMKNNLVVSESELATQSVIDQDWPAATSFSTQALYIGAGNNSGKAENGMAGRVYDFTIMEDGKPVHKYIPARYNGKAGLYDEVLDTTFIFTSDGMEANALIHDKRCIHRYRITRKDGVVERHCQVCDYMPMKTYYSDITFHPGAGDVDGMMPPQTIDVEGHLRMNSFSRPMCALRGWSKTEGSRSIDYSDQAYIQPDSDHCGTMNLYAVWDECYVVRKDTIPIPDNNVVDTVWTEDSSKEHTGMAARRPITIKNFEYYRELPAGTEWGTVCLPIPLASNDSVTYYTKARVEGKRLILTRAGSVAPNTPCIFHVVSKDVKFLYLQGNNAYFDGKTENSGGDGGLEIVGTYEDLQIDCSGKGQDYYVINGDKFYHVKSSVDVTPFRAYLKAPIGATSARELTIIEEGETSAEAITDYELRIADGKYLEDGKVVIYTGDEKYDINGRRNK